MSRAEQAKEPAKERTAGPPRRRPSNGASDSKRDTPLSREQITAVALDVADQGELDALTMRSLAEALGVTAMALYSHIENKDDILDAVIDRMLEREALALPPRDADWKAWIAEGADRLRRVLTRYPALLDRYCRRPVGVPAALHRMEATLEVLARAGFDDTSRVVAYATIHTYTLGFAALEIAREISSQRTSGRSTELLTQASRHYWPAFFADLPGSEFPNLTRLRPDLAEFTNDAQFREGLRTVLDGLDAEHGQGSERMSGAGTKQASP